MRRADRLFQIIQVLRRTRKPLTADAIAAELETSKRTIYRDITTLIEQRVPIRGEAGVGYILEKGFDLPPLMLTPDEIEACVLGAQWVVGHADPALARAAQDLMAKVAETVPERLRPFVLEPASRARSAWNREPDRIDMVRTRTQIHEGKKITLNYRDEHGRDSQRTIWPIAVGYHEAVRILAAWCELRKDFRSFRTDRVVDAVYHDERYPERRDILRAKWRRSLGLNAGHASNRRRSRKPLPGLRRLLQLLAELAAFHHRGRCGARPDPGTARQRKIIGNALRRRPLLGAVGQGRRGDGVFDLCGAARSVPHLHARRCRMRDGTQAARIAGASCRPCERRDPYRVIYR